MVNAALTYGLTVVGLTDVVDRLFLSGQQSISLGNVIYYVLVGIPLALIGWSNMEGKYHKALQEARVANTSQITSHLKSN